MLDVPKNDEDTDTYEEQFIRFADRMEKWLVRLLAMLLLLFIISQGLLQFPAVRTFLTPVDSLEGIPFERN